MSIYDPITPTLANLRAALLDGMPPKGEELIFDLWEDEEFDSPEETYSPDRRLPDCILVTQEGCERVLSGEFDHLPNSTPIQELFA